MPLAGLVCEACFHDIRVLFLQRAQQPMPLCPGGAIYQTLSDLCFNPDSSIYWAVALVNLL